MNMDMEYRPKKNMNKNNKNKNSDDEVEFDEYSQYDSLGNDIGNEKYETDCIFDYDYGDTPLNVNEYITQFDNKYPNDYPEYEDSTAKFVKKIVKIKSLYVHLELKWKPLFYLQKVREEKKLEDVKKAADKAFADKVRDNKLRMAAEEARLDAIVAALPTESKATREARLKAEAEERNRLIEEAREKARKEDESRSFRYRKSNMSESGRYFKLNKIDSKVKEAQKEEQLKKKKLEKKLEKKALEDVANGKFTPSNTGNAERDKLIDERLARERHIKEMIVNEQQEKLDEPYIDLTGIDDEIEKNDDEEDNEEEEIMKIAINIVKSWGSNLEKKDSIYDKKIVPKVIKEDDSKEWTTVPSKNTRKIDPLILKMGAMSFKTEQYQKYQKRVKERENMDVNKYEVIPQTEDEIEREAALIKLKQSKGTVSTKSRMCSTYGTKQTCRHGNDCKFAHSIEELSPSDCFFGNKCQFIVSTGRKCDHIHPQENKIAYCKRIGIKMSKVPVKKQSRANDQLVITIKLPSLSIWNNRPNILREYIEKETHIHINNENTTIEDKRSEALEKLKSAKDKISTKSQMCSSFGNKKSCKHGTKCRFAHTIEELTPSNCFFGEQCQFIHNLDKKCMHIHNCEDKNEYCKRVGIGSKEKNITICRSVGTGKNCYHGSKCRFLH